MNIFLSSSQKGSGVFIFSRCYRRISAISSTFTRAACGGFLVSRRLTIRECQTMLSVDKQMPRAWRRQSDAANCSFSVLPCVERKTTRTDWRVFNQRALSDPEFHRGQKGDEELLETDGQKQSFRFVKNGGTNPDLISYNLPKTLASGTLPLIISAVKLVKLFSILFKSRAFAP